MQWLRTKLRDLKINWSETRNKIRKNWWKVILAIIFLILVILLIWAGYVRITTGVWPDWTGFGNKTLWDLIPIIPVILAIRAYWLHNRQGIALQTYLDRMAEMLVKEKLRESEVESEVRAVARERTLTVLRGLDGDRKGALLRFLYEAGLIDKDKIVINLDGADLSGANLSKANLSEANLSKAKLEGAKLIGADLRKANLSKAKLIGAFLILATLWRANLSGANLSGADLIGADLFGAKLSGAKYTKNAQDIRGTIWPDGFDPEKAGAERVNE